jgi:hypothetical protein
MPKTPLLAVALLISPLAARPEPAFAPPAQDRSAPATTELASALPSSIARSTATVLATATATPTATPTPTPTAPPTATATATPPPKKKHGIFPLWGDKVRAKGFSLPQPFGFMVNHYYQQSDIEITNLKLRFNGGEWLDASGLIEVPKARAQGSVLAIRPNLMVFPFLSVYALFSSGATETDVDVEVLAPDGPISFSTTAKSGAQVLALGATAQFGWKGFFGVADFNGAVSDVERLADHVGSNLLSFRAGYNFGTPGGRGFAAWVGTAGQVLDVETEGTVRLGEVLPPPSGDRIDAAQARCDVLPPGRRQDACNAVVQAMRELGSGAGDSTVDYSLDKKPAGTWNMILGAQYALDEHWHFRFETTFLNSRFSTLAAVEYRWDML